VPPVDNQHQRFHSPGRTLGLAGAHPQLRMTHQVQILDKCVTIGSLAVTYCR
jgi:hypothetical protein